MTVLARELDAYQRALDVYQRHLKKHNKNVDAYNETLVKDANGNLMVVDAAGNVSSVDDAGRVIAAALPEGFAQTDYGTSAISGSGYRMLRQQPIEANREEMLGLRKITDENGHQYYVDRSGQYVNITPEWRLDGTTPAQETWDSYTPESYNYSRDASTYMQKPAEWARKMRIQKPDPTTAQMARMARPTLAAVEAGLVGEIMKGKGSK